MYILAVDTSTNCCSVAVSCNSKLISEINLNVKSSHSKFVLKLIEQAISNADLQLYDINLLAITKGPGSFTGLRIGMSALKGLGYSLDIPIITISSLDVLHYQTDFSTKYLCPIIDARKNEVYYSIYQKNSGKVKQDSVGSITSVLDQIDGTVTFTGNGVDIYKNNISRHTISKNSEIKASVVAKIAYEKFTNNFSNEMFNCEPMYIRKSDAELNLKK